MGHRFTIKILIGMVLGIGVGLALKWLPIPDGARFFLVNNVFDTLGQMFIQLIKMLVVPIVFVSLVCGSASLGGFKKFGRIGGKTLLLYIVTTALAVTIALVSAELMHVGEGLYLKTAAPIIQKTAPSLKSIFINIVPSNPFKSLTQGLMLQIIIFAVLFGMAISAVGQKAKKVLDLFQATNEVLMKFIIMVMQTAPYGVFCLLVVLFARQGFGIFLALGEYFLVVTAVLLIQLLFVYSALLNFLGRLNPIHFFRKMYAAMIFAFSVSSSNASIPIVLETVEKKLGVGNSVASFVIPFGATINMDGTAIMQGVATVFIAHAYHIALGITGYLTVILMATLASIGTAGVPSVGLITLAMVLEQLGLPVAGIALIIGVDRLLDMLRTVVNISGDSMVACLVGKSEKAMDVRVFNDLS